MDFSFAIARTASELPDDVPRHTDASERIEPTEHFLLWRTSFETAFTSFFTSFNHHWTRPFGEVLSPRAWLQEHRFLHTSDMLSLVEYIRNNKFWPKSTERRAATWDWPIAAIFLSPYFLLSTIKHYGIAEEKQVMSDEEEEDERKHQWSDSGVK